MSHVCFHGSVAEEFRIYCSIIVLHAGKQSYWSKGAFPEMGAAVLSRGFKHTVYEWW